MSTQNTAYTKPNYVTFKYFWTYTKASTAYCLATGPEPLPKRVLQSET
jgi:hypothetical protein